MAQPGVHNGFHVRLTEPPAHAKTNDVRLGEARLAAERSNEASFELWRAAQPSDNYAISPYGMRLSLGAFSVALLPAAARNRLQAVLHYAQGSQAADLGLLRRVVIGAESQHFFAASGLWLASPSGAGDKRGMPQPLAPVSEVHSVRFAIDPARARKVIDAWGAAQTRGGISNLMGGHLPTRKTQVALLDVAYLSWSGGPTSSGSRTPGTPFTTSNGKKVRADELTCTECPAAILDDCVVTNVGYPGEDVIRLVVVMPNDWSSFSWSMATFRRVWQGQKAWRHAHLVMPRFSVKSSVDVRKVLARLGVELQSERAESRSADVPRTIDIVGHSAGIQVEMATVVIEPMVGGVSDGLLPRPVLVRIDRPFYWALVELRADLVLMMGQVTDPTAAGG